MAKKSRQATVKTGASARSSAAGADPDDALEGALALLWKAIAAGDVLEAEFQSSAVVALPELTDRSPEEVARVADALVDATSQHSPRSEAAAFFRLLMSLGPRPVRRAASRGLAECTDEGVYPASWVTAIGRPALGRAWRQDDVFGDNESIVVTFSYDGAEHALLVVIDLAELPTVDLLGLDDDPEGLLKAVEDQAGPHQRLTEITLAEARRRLEGPLSRAGDDPAYELDESSTLALPIARSRVRRLPADDPPGVAYTAADRAAVVAEFLARPEAAEAGDPAVARFWATVLTGYSSRVPDEPPAQVGPHKIAAMLLMHAASTFTLTAAERDSMGPAVTAWTRWAVARQGLDEAAAERVMASLAEVLDAFPDEYDHPYATACRGYLRDVATADVDLSWLADQRARREFAAPITEQNDPDVDGATTKGRAAMALAEFSPCADGDAGAIKLLTAVPRIVEEIWHDNPATTWEKAKRLLAEGLDRHEVIHALAG